MLAFLGFLFLAGSSLGIDTLKPAAAAFHNLESAAERKQEQASPELLSKALSLERDVRDWVAIQLPQQTAIGTLRRAGILGAGDSIDISRPRTFPAAILVRVSVRVPGGTDSSAWLYELREGKWVRTLSLERTQRITASQLYDVGFSPPDKSGTHLAVAVRGPAAGSGCWHTVGFQLYRVGTPTPPPLLMDDLHTANLCERGPTAKADMDGFSVTLLDRDLAAGSTRIHILRYQLWAERPQRIQPVALGPREFVHEWLSRDWKEAIDWTARPVRATLEKTHRELGGLVSGEYRSVSPCGENRSQVEINLEKGGVRYFLVEELGKNEFRLLGVSAGASDCGAR